MSQENRIISKISVGDDNVVFFKFSGKTNLISAKILESSKLDDGTLTYMLLDRLIHQSHETSFDVHINNQWVYSFQVTGCYVSELNKKIMEI